jgi:BolA family transcriptional regulator, general stress-responsive regulator
MTQDRVALIRARLEAAFEPLELDIIDESHLHAGHVGARDGRGHFRVRLVSSRFSGTSSIERHRMVYEALDDLMTSEIHALTIGATAPEKLT